MEMAHPTCPACGQALSEGEGFFVCDEHGKWYRYSANLLVRSPSPEAKVVEHVAMPWERLVPAV